jgi:asparagine synthase (glutamine-hydrolysing)
MRVIAGLWLFRTSGSPDPSVGEQCATMLASFEPSGRSGRKSDVLRPGPEIALGVCPLDSCNADTAGDPVSSANDAAGQSWHMVADARLDNRDELRSELGLTLQDDLEASDSALLFQAWLRWGEDCLDRLSGGFAFACWNSHSRRLFLARDHTGERPLFFSRPPGLFAFASMPRALRTLAPIGSHLSVSRMADFLAVITPSGTETFFEGIERLLPGHAIAVTGEQVSIRRYWHPVDAKPIRYRRDEDYIEDFRERFDRAVSARLRSSRPVASQLSGGLDSASVTATAARLLAQRQQRLMCFTAVPVPEYGGSALIGRFGDEGAAAAETAKLYSNIEHVLIDSSEQQLFRSIERGSGLADQPVFNPTNQMWVDAILDGVRTRGMDVLLQGVCGNATISFGGLIGLSELLRSGRWLTLVRQVRELRANGHTSWRAAASWAAGGVLPKWMRRLMNRDMGAFNFSFSPVHPDRATEYHLQERAFEEFFGSDTSTEAFRRQFYEYYDAGHFTAAVAMGWGVENRDPTQDRGIFEFCFAIPVEQYLVEGQSRSLIRRAMRGRLPEATLARTTRGLQAADWYLVMGREREQMGERLGYIEQSALARHVLDLPRLRRLLDTWPSEGFDRVEVHYAYHLALSRGLAAGMFIRNLD